MVKHDPRTQSLVNKTWQLYSEDLVDTSNGQNNYVSRKVVDTCVERIVFMIADTLIQYDSCNGQTPVTRTGGWIWYLPDGIFSAQIYSGPDDQLVKRLYHYSEDSLQIETDPGLAVDSAYTKFYLRIRTYVIK